jgi:hypothetical protein
VAHFDGATLPYGLHWRPNASPLHLTNHWPVGPQIGSSGHGRLGVALVDAHVFFEWGSEIRVVDDPFPPQAVEARHFMPGREGAQTVFLL